MRTNIELDDELLAKAMKATGSKTKRAAVEEGLRLLVRTHAQGSIRDLRGKVAFWDGYRENFRSSDPVREW